MNRRRSPTTSTTPLLDAQDPGDGRPRGKERSPQRSHRSVGVDRAETTSRASMRSREGRPSEAILDELLEAVRDREPFAGRHVTSTAKERAVRSPGRRRDCLPTSRGGSGAWSGRTPSPDLVPEHPFQGVQRQRSDVDGVHAILGEGRRRRPGVVIGTGASSGRHQPTCSSFRPPHDELEHSGPRGVSIHWTSSTATTTGEVEATDRRHPSTRQETARWSARAPDLGGAQEGHLEGLALWLRQRRERLARGWARGGHRVRRRTARVSASTGPHERCGSRRELSIRQPSFHTVVLPMPGSPDRSNALGPLGIESRNRWRTARNSGSRPMTPPERCSPRLDGRLRILGSGGREAREDPSRPTHRSARTADKAPGRVGGGRGGIRTRVRSCP